MNHSLLRIVLLWALLCTLARAAAPVCPGAADIQPRMLIGRWQIEWIDGTRPRGAGPWVLELGPHPEYADSLKGRLRHDQARALVVADWDDENLTMEESPDGKRIAATWQATAVDGRCGREFQGVRFTGSEPDASARRFRMRALSP
ncbi:MAG: hypothetical protein ACKOWC_13410 [Limnohabitans sp.]